MPWYALQVYGGNEEKARKKLLLEHGTVKTLLPQRVLQIRRQGKVSIQKRPFFEGYFFLHWDHPLNTLEARDIVGSLRNLGGQPGVIRMTGVTIDKQSTGSDLVQPVSEDEMEVILELTKENEEVGFSSYMFEGNQIQIVSGPLKGQEAKVVKVDPRKKRIKVEVSLLGRLHKIDLAAEMAQPAKYS